MIKKISCFIVCVLLCILMGIPCFAKSSKELKFDENNIVLKFMSTSDTHMATDKTDNAKKFDNAIKKAQELAGGKDFLNAITVSGDIFDYHPLTEAPEIKKIFDDNIDPQKTELILAIGNHDAYYDKAFSGKNTFKDAFGDYVYKNPDVDNSALDILLGNYDTVINGFHFITVRAVDGDDPQDSLIWLGNRLAVDTAKDKTMPVFVFQHVPPANTCGGSYEEGRFQSKNIAEVLQQYPQAVVITGHTHANAKCEEAVWQGGFTAVNCGTCQNEFHYIEVDKKGFIRMRTYSTSTSFSSQNMAYSREFNVPVDLSLVEKQESGIPVFVVVIIIVGVLILGAITCFVIVKSKKQKIITKE